jgi:hypothetical protein
MNKLKKITMIFAFLFFPIALISQQFNPKGFDCVLPDNPPSVNQSVIGGQHKPESIDRYTNDPLAVFRVLFVFVQFPNDPGPPAEYWPVNSPPTYINSVISGIRRNNTSWWDAYSETNEATSDFWMEASRGHFHVVGKAVNVILPNDSRYYTAFGIRGIEKINDDIYAILQNDPSIFWPDYDLWSKSGSTFNYTPDGRIDMIYKVHRSHSPFIGMPAGGIALLYNSYSQGVDYKIYDDGQGTVRYINGGFGDNGSGLTMTPGHGWPEGHPNYFRYAPMNKLGVVSFSEHEHGHFLYGSSHQKYGKMMGAGAHYGLDEFLSPYESVRLGYMSTKSAVFNSTNSINDYSSRDNNLQGQVLEVPISGSNEFFLIANRQRVSNYDRIMWGDKAHGDPYNIDVGDLGKGVYIYHASPNSSGYPWLISIDQECADGLWDWVQDGFRFPDWSCVQNVEYYKRNTVVYNANDDGGNGQLTIHDGKSLESWFGLGRKEIPVCSGNTGLDRIETNLIENVPYSYQYPYEVWTSREWQGDRWDAWGAGYNEVFSPYSSPSTSNWSNQGSGVYIYLESQSGTQANFKIYKVGEGGLTDNDILALTPPSKPMNLKSEFCYQSATFPYYYYNKLTWNHNQETDMKRSNGNGGFNKRYKIYKVSSADMVTLPNENNYSVIATVDIDENQIPSYVDFSEPSGCNEPPDGPCPPICWTLHAVRYRVVAVDASETSSVKSDFASSSAYSISGNGGGIEEGDNLLTVPELPKTFSLLQNYPNPFNPSTDIKFELPRNTYVTVKVFNALGEEIAILMNNEYKTTGRYSVTFDGSIHASGIYFYSIDAGQFRDTKKMILIK